MANHVAQAVHLSENSWAHKPIIGNRVYKNSVFPCSSPFYNFILVCFGSLFELYCDPDASQQKCNFFFNLVIEDYFLDKQRSKQPRSKPVPCTVDRYTVDRRLWYNRQTYDLNQMVYHSLHRVTIFIIYFIYSLHALKTCKSLHYIQGPFYWQRDACIVSVPFFSARIKAT